MIAGKSIGRIWDALLERLQAAWPDESLHWDQTPLELVTRLVNERDELRAVEAVIADQAEWSNTQFGSERGPLGSLRHLRIEVEEAINNPADIIEYADIQLLLWDAMRRAGFRWPQLIQAAGEKMEINRSREWKANETPPDQPVLHRRTAPELGAIHQDGGHPEHVPAPSHGSVYETGRA